MRERRFGWTGIDVPVLGQGTWKMEADDRASAIRALRRGLDLGMRHIDTAELYGGGSVEQLVAEAIAGRRDEVFLASKVLPSNASYTGTLQACEQSLRRLKTDRLDLYLLHWTGAFPLEETFRAFEELVEAGKVRFWGVSNFDRADLEEAIELVGEERIACNQVLYHLEERYIEHEVLPFCEEHRIALVGYSPFGSGSFPAGEGRRLLDEIGRAHGASAYQVALAFLVRKPGLFGIPKASTAAHVEQNAAAAELVLSAEELARIDEAFPPGMADELPVI